MKKKILKYIFILYLLTYTQIKCFLPFNPTENPSTLLQNDINKFSPLIPPTPPFIGPSLSSTKSIELPFKLTDAYQAIVTLCIGTPPQCFPFKLATNINESFLLSIDAAANGFNQMKSATIDMGDSEAGWEHSGEEYHGWVCKDTLTIPEAGVTINGFSFLLAYQGKIKQNYIGILGLGRKYEENTFSFVGMLYLQNIINNQIFSLTYLDSSNGIFKVGFHDTSNRREFNSIQLVEGDNEPSFEVYMDSIIFENVYTNALRTFNRQQLALFSPGANRIFCPKKFFNFYYRRIIVKYNNLDKYCTKNEDDNYASITCTKDIKNKELGRLIFIFGKWSFSMNLIDLFAEKNGSMESLIVRIKGESRWNFGYPFIRKFQTVFDGDNDLVKIRINKKNNL